MACPFLLAIGFAILLVSEFTGLAALRIVAVGVLLTGAIGGGVRAANFGNSAAEPPALFARIAARFTHNIARVIVVLLMLPVVLTLILALTGAALHPHDDRFSAAAMAAGAAVALLLLAVLAAALTIAFRALRRAEKSA